MKLLITLLMTLSLCACGTKAVCGFPCQLEIEQEENLLVGDFLEKLETYAWIDEVDTLLIEGSIQTDNFSHVMETSISLNVVGNIGEYRFSEITLYISSVGSASSPDWTSVRDEIIEAIYIKPKMTLFNSIELFGLPHGGEIIPFSPSTTDLTMLCQDRSHYVAYYDDGRMILRSSIQRPIQSNLWISPVEIIYPFGSNLEFSRNMIGQYRSINHRPCN